MKSWTVSIKGMKCQGCVDTVKAVLESVPGVRQADVDLQKEEAHVLCEDSTSKTVLVESVNKQTSFKAS